MKLENLSYNLDVTSMAGLKPVLQGLPLLLNMFQVFNWLSLHLFSNALYIIHKLLLNGKESSKKYKHFICYLLVVFNDIQYITTTKV